MKSSHQSLTSFWIVAVLYTSGPGCLFRRSTGLN
jgi:hypothetical protein